MVELEGKEFAIQSSHRLNLSGMFLAVKHGLPDAVWETWKGQGKGNGHLKAQVAGEGHEKRKRKSWACGVWERPA